MKNLVFFYCGKMLPLLVAVLAYFPISAQIVPISHILPDGDNGESYDGLVDFDYTGVNQNDVSWVWTATAGGVNLTSAQIQSNIGLTLDGATGEVRGSFTGAAVPTGSVVTFQVTGSVSGVPRTKNYNLLIRSSALGGCDDIKFALVMDASGSMNSSAGSTTRWGELQDAVMSFLPSLNNWVDPANDSLQILYFTTALAGNAIERFDGTFDEIDWRDSLSAASDIFGTMGPGGGTPIGTGVNLADFSTGLGKRAIILFTDGHQNVIPMYDGASHTIGGTTIPANIDIYSIGVSGCDVTMIERIARPTGTAPSASAFTYNAGDLDNLFQETIPEIFDGCSPRVVSQRSGTISAGIPTVEEFQVDSLVNSISFQLKCKTGNCYNPETLSLSLNGTPIDPVFYNTAASYKNNGYEFRGLIPLPLITSEDATDAIDGGGKWTVQFAGSAGREYSLRVIVDDKYIDTDLMVGNGADIYAGDPIPVEATAQLLGTPLNDIAVFAILLRPGEDPGRLFSETSYDPGSSDGPLENEVPPGLSQSHLNALAKVDGLLADPAFLAQLAEEERIIPLVNDGSGRYQGTFLPADTEVSSYYTVMAVFDGYVPGLDTLKGIETDRFHVQFSRPEDIDLQETITYTGQGLDGGYAAQFRPMNKFGNPLGPANAQHIRFVVGKQTLVLQDQLDGTYTASFGSTPGSLAPIEIYVLDQETPVVKRKVGPVFGLSLHAGSLFGLSSTGPLQNYSSGFYWGGDLTYRFSSRWYLEALVSNNDFGSDGSMLEAGLMIGVQSGQPLVSGFAPYLQAGIGYFDPDIASEEFGLSARAGLSRFFSQRLQAGVEVGGSYVLNHEYLFGKVGVFTKLFF